MLHVDALSRNLIENSNNLTELDEYSNVRVINNEDWLHTLQLGDSELCRIRVLLLQISMQMV